MMGVIYIAETTYNYRELRRGNISNDEFKKRQVIGAVAKVSSILGTSIGGACGFLVGSAIMPGIGSVIGVVLGGITASLVLRAMTARAAERVYELLEQSK
jgi:type III secretory pathway component EscV